MNYYKNFMGLHGFPTAMQLSRISFTTTEPAPIITLFPTCTGPIIVTLAPSATLLPIVGLPFSVFPSVVQ